MSKIGLKPWQHFLVLGVLALLVIALVITNLGGGDQKIKDNGKMFGRFEIEYQNADSVMRLFYPGISVSDSIRYEEISGATSGFRIEVYLVAAECDYTLSFDSRDAEVYPEEGDTLVYTTYYLSEKTYTNFSMNLESRVGLNPRTAMTDELSMSDYYVSIMCIQKDSCISIKGVATASAYILNPMMEDDQLYINGYFRADSIPIGKRTVN